MDRHISSTLLGCLNIGYMPKISLFTIISPNWNPIQHATNWRVTDRFWERPAHRHTPPGIHNSLFPSTFQGGWIPSSWHCWTQHWKISNSMSCRAGLHSWRTSKRSLIGFGAAGKLRSFRWLWFICSYLLAYIYICLHVANLTSNLLIFYKGMVTS